MEHKIEMKPSSKEGWFDIYVDGKVVAWIYENSDGNLFMTIFNDKIVYITIQKG